MQAEDESPTGAESKQTWWFGRKISKGEVPSLDMDPPTGSMGDVFDDDLARWSFYRRPKLTGWLAAEELSRQLQQEVDNEYDDRQRQRPASDVAAEEQRKNRLLELVAAALRSDLSDAWAKVDAMVGTSDRHNSQP